MKKKFMKKAAAVSLSVAMACAALPAAGPINASAAAKYVTLRTKFKTLKVGQKNKMTLINNTQGWKISKIATEDRTIAMVSAKTASSFQIKGKSEGRTVVKARLKTNAKKKVKSKLVKCTVNVVPAEKPDNNNPNPTPTPSVTEKTVVTQEQLTAALSDSSLKKITIATTETASLTIPAGTHADVDLVVNAPNAEITNNGVFKSIEIQAIKASSWTENASGNALRVTAANSRILVSKDAVVASITYTKADAAAGLEVNGTVKSVLVNVKMNLTLSGTPQAAVPVSMTAAAAVLTSSARTDVTAAVNVQINLNKGAEDSTIKLQGDKTVVRVENNTTKNVSVARANGQIVNVGPNSSTNVAAVVSASSSSSSGSTYYPSTNPENPGTTRIVRTNAALQSALADKSVTKLTIRTTEKENFTIGKGEYKADLIVDAPNSDVTNEGTFNTVTIQAIKGDTWFEKAAGNFLKVLAKIARIKVDKNANVKNIQLAPAEDDANVTLEVEGKVETVAVDNEKASAAVTVDVKGEGASVGTVKVNDQASGAQAAATVTLHVAEKAAVSNVTVSKATAQTKLALTVAAESTVSNVNIEKESGDVASVSLNVDGTVSNVKVESKTDITITGTTTEPVKVEVAETAAETKVESSVQVEVSAEAKTEIKLEEGAEGSTITTTDKENVALDNQTKAEVAIKDETTNETETVQPGESSDAAESEKVDISAFALDTFALDAPAVAVKPTSGESITVSGASVEVTINGIATAIKKQVTDQFTGLTAEDLTIQYQAGSGTSEDLTDSAAFKATYGATEATGAKTLSIAFTISGTKVKEAKAVTAVVKFTISEAGTVSDAGYDASN